jgi:hypothetical protein
MYIASVIKALQIVHDTSFYRIRMTFWHIFFYFFWKFVIKFELHLVYLLKTPLESLHGQFVMLFLLQVLHFFNICHLGYQLLINWITYSIVLT